VRALAEDLVLPLSLGHFGVDAFVVDAGVEAEVEMLLDDGAGDRAIVLVADAANSRGLEECWGSRLWGKAERTAIL